MDCYSRTAAKFHNDDIFQLRIASVTMDNEATFASVNLLDEITDVEEAGFTHGALFRSG